MDGAGGYCCSMHVFDVPEFAYGVIFRADMGGSSGDFLHGFVTGLSSQVVRDVLAVESETTKRRSSDQAFARV